MSSNPSVAGPAYDASDDPFVDVDQVDFLQPSINRLNPVTATANVALNSGTGNTMAMDAAQHWFTSALMPAAPGQMYAFYNAAAAHTAMICCFYDVHGRFLHGITADTATAPGGAAQFRVSFRVAGMVIRGASNPGKFIPFAHTINQDLVTEVEPQLMARLPWRGKRWVALGDSITFQALYVPTASQMLGMPLASNLGVPGQLLRTMADRLTPDIARAADLITVMGGTNDYGHGGARLGSFSDSPDANTIYGAVKHLVRTIQLLNPVARLMFITCPRRGAYSHEPVDPAPNYYGLTMEGISTAMQDACRRLGIPCLDLYGQSGFNEYTLRALTQDNLHPNAAGAAIIGRMIGTFANNL